MKNASSGAVASANSFKEFVRSINWADYIIYIVFIGIFILFSITLHDRGFLGADNLMNIALQTALISIMAVGMTFVLSAAEIDLSFGAVAALAGLTAALMIRHTDSVFLAVIAGLCIGILAGVINGFFVTVVGIPSFLMTLGMIEIVNGSARWISNLQSIPADNDLFTFIFGAGEIGVVPIILIWTFVVTVIGAIMLKKTPFGREVLAVGGNKVSAMYSGIKVGKIKMLVFILNASLAALAGILYTGRNFGAKYTLGDSFLMTVIAAVIIGGTSLFGGKGTVIGSLFGALIMGMINNGLTLMNLSNDKQMILRGLIIIISVTIMTLSAKKRV
jgi:ribose transport system permease protein